MSSLTVILLIQIILACAADAQQVIPLTSELESKLDRIATQDVPTRAPGIATGIVQNGKIIYSKCAGLEDLDSKSLITPKSRFNIASTGKQFTALAIIQLEADGELSFKDDIRKYFQGFYKKIESPITIEHLLTHTSGIRDIHHLWSLQGKTWWKNEFRNHDAMALLAKQEDLNFIPGSEHLYSNSNYIVLAELVAKVSGRSFKAYTDSMFKQLGMPNTSFESDHNAIRGPIAKPYFNFQTWKTYDWLPDLVGDGALFSTLDDQLQWECLVQGAGETEFDRTLIEKSQQIVNAELSEQYGFGLELRDDGGLKRKYHEGSTGAWKAYSLRYPDQTFSIVTLSNSGKTIPTMQSQQMVNVLIATDSDTESNAFLTEPEKAGFRVEVDEILGTYTSGGGFFFQFIQYKGKLLLRRDGRGDVLVERESANVFREVNDPKFKQEFVKNENDEMQVTAYYTTHAPYSLTRPNNDWAGFDFKNLNGTFTNSETGSEIQIEHVKEQQYTFALKGKKTRNARLVSRNRLISGSYVVQWPRELKQNTTNFMLRSDRVRNVKYIRIFTNDQDAAEDLSNRTQFRVFWIPASTTSNTGTAGYTEK